MTSDEIQHFLQNLSNYQNLSEFLYDPEKQKSTFENVTKIFFYSMTILVGLFANGLLIGVISSTKSLRTKFNLYIINLAVADVLVICFCSWVHLVSDLHQQWILGASMCKANTFIQVTVVSSSILTLTTTVVDRFLAAKHPHYLQLTQKCQSGVLLMIWTISVLVALPWLLYMEQVEFQWATGLEVDCEDLFPSKETKKIYITVFAIVFYVIPVVTMFCLIFAILYVPPHSGGISGERVMGHRPGLHRVQSDNSVSQFSETEDERRVSLQIQEVQQIQRMRKNVANMTLTLLVVFFMCWTPQQTTLVWDVYRDRHKKKPEGIAPFKYIALYLAYSSSAFHPIVYIVFNKCFRTAAWKSLRFWRRGDNSVIAVRPMTSEETPA